MATSIVHMHGDGDKSQEAPTNASDQIPIVWFHA